MKAGALLVALLSGMVAVTPSAVAAEIKPILSERCEDTPLPADFDPGSPDSVNKRFKDAPRILFALGPSRRTALKRLLADGENPNVCVFNSSLLSLSASTGDADEVRVLLDGGADLEKPRSAGGGTPLLDAIGAGRFAIGELLMARGADVLHTTDGGTTALHTLAMADVSDATRELQLALAGELIARGVPVDAKLHVPQTTALMLAALRGNEPLVELLLNRGADPELRGAKGQTALDFAQKRGYSAIVELLSKTKSKP